MTRSQIKNRMAPRPALAKLKSETENQMPLFDQIADCLRADEKVTICWLQPL